MGSAPTESSLTGLHDQDGYVQCGVNAALKYKPFKTIGKDLYEGKFEEGPVAVRKSLSKSGIITEPELPNEVKILRFLKDETHENIIKYKCSSLDVQHGYSYLALELCKSNIETYLNSQTDPLPKRIDTRQDIKKRLIKDIINGLHYLHGKGIIHCDLKPKNILLKDSGQVVISDFRMSNIEGISNNDKHRRIDGWKPKELVEKLNTDEDISWTKKADIFSFGCIVHYVMAERSVTSEDNDFILHPFGGVNKRIKRIIDDERASYVSISNNKTRRNFTLDDILADMLVGICIDGDTQCRPNTEEITNHPFFWNAKSKYMFIENIANSVNHMQLSESRKEDLQKLWRRYYNKVSYEDDVPEAVKYFTEEYYETLKAEAKVKAEAKAEADSIKSRSKEHNKYIVNLVTDIRNLKQHYSAIVKARRNKKCDPKHITVLLKEGLEEDFDRYFIQKIKQLLPVVYTWCLYDVPREETKKFLDYISKTEKKEEIYIRKKVYWETLDKVHSIKKTDESINKTDESKKRAIPGKISTSYQGSSGSRDTATGNSYWEQPSKKRRGRGRGR